MAVLNIKNRHFHAAFFEFAGANPGSNAFYVNDLWAVNVDKLSFLDGLQKYFWAHASPCNALFTGFSPRNEKAGGFITSHLWDLTGMFQNCNLASPFANE